MTEPATTPEAAPETPATPELDRDTEWQRLDPRMLLVHPIRELIRFFPALIAIAFAGRSGGGEFWQLLFVAVPIGLGLLRYLTTSFRISAGRIELQRGLFNRHVLSTPVDRVRTVDLTSSPIHRLLGLTKVRVGTGTASSKDEEKLDLDGLPLDRARELRTELLGTSHAAEAGAGDPSAPTPAIPDRVVVSFDPAWVRFAPFTGSGVVIAAAALGALSQLFNTLGLWRHVSPDRIEHSGSGLPVAVVIVIIVAILVVAVSLLAIGGYVVTNWGFVLTRGATTWHITRGLFTTRETTLDDERVAGASISEPLGLRLVRGSRLNAIVTGLDRKQRGSSALVPPAPRTVVDAVARETLDSPEPVDALLVRHGPRAVRRRWTRAMVPALAVAAACVGGDLAGAGSWLLPGLIVLPVAALLAADRAASLGHALVAGHLVARSGSLTRRRRALAVEHVIGWNFQSSWFQRRAGLTTLVATTAGGSQSVPVLDVPEAEAVAVAADALPDLVRQFARARVELDG